MSTSSPFVLRLTMAAAMLASLCAPSVDAQRTEAEPVLRTETLLQGRVHMTGTGYRIARDTPVRDYMGRYRLETDIGVVEATGIDELAKIVLIYLACFAPLPACVAHSSGAIAPTHMAVDAPTDTLCVACGVVCVCSVLYGLCVGVTLWWPAPRRLLGHLQTLRLPPRYGLARARSLACSLARPHSAHCTRASAHSLRPVCVCCALCSEENVRTLAKAIWQAGVGVWIDGMAHSATGAPPDTLSLTYVCLACGVLFVLRSGEALPGR